MRHLFAEMFFLRTTQAASYGNKNNLRLVFYWLLFLA